MIDAPQSDFAVIGGTGLEQMPGFDSALRYSVDTPFGPPSGDVLVGRIGAARVAFLSRHGVSHSLAPHEVNYRANVFAVSRYADTVVAVAAVGAIDARFAPGDLVVPHQIIDYTWGRAHTFSGAVPAGGGDEVLGEVLHVDFSEPYAAPLRARLVDAAVAVRAPVHDGAVYGATQGPRLETAAEIDRLERDGCGVVGMTGMPEAGLARELGLAYACLAVVVNPAAGRADGEITLDLIRGHLAVGMSHVHNVLGALGPG